MTVSKLSCLLLVAASAAISSSYGATTVGLHPVPDAFARLGHSCGGIRQQIIATGFDANLNPTGYVYLTTTCSTGGRGSRPATYSMWLAVTWSLSGVVIAEAPSVPSPDPSIAGAYHSGGLVGGANYPTCNNTSPYSNSFSCFSTPVVSSTGNYSVQTTLSVTNQAACSAAVTAYCSYTAAVTEP